MKSLAPLKLETVLAKHVAGIPDLNQFVFELNDRVSFALNYDASEDEVASAVLELFSPKCPKSLGKSIGGFAAY